MDWNCDLLSCVRMDQPNSGLEAVDTMQYLAEEHRVSHFCMMPLFDAQKEPVSVFLLKRSDYENCLKRIVPKSISLKFSAKVLLYKGISENRELYRLTQNTGGYLPVLLPITAYEDWIDEELNRLLYKHKIKLLFLSCELFPILYPDDIVEKLLRIEGAIYQFGYQALSDTKLCRLIYNMYRLNRPILFGTGVNCKKRAWSFPITQFRNSATSLFSKPDLQKLDHFSKQFWIS